MDEEKTIPDRCYKKLDGADETHGQPVSENLIPVKQKRRNTREFKLLVE